MPRLLLLLTLGLLLTSCARTEPTVKRLVRVNGVSETIHCAGYRVAAKYGTDPQSARLSPTITATTIRKLNSLPHPKGITGHTGRGRHVESRVWSVEARVDFFRLEDDQDYHIGLIGPSGATMVAEVASPECTPRSSAFYSNILKAREQAKAIFGSATSGHPEDLRVKVTGPGFFDFPHGGSDQGPNTLEIHPVWSITNIGQ